MSIDISLQSVRDQICDKCLIRMLRRGLESYKQSEVPFGIWRTWLIVEASRRGLLAELFI